MRRPKPRSRLPCCALSLLGIVVFWGRRAGTEKYCFIILREKFRNIPRLGRERERVVVFFLLMLFFGIEPDWFLG